MTIVRDTRSVKLQAYLAVSPRHPRWSDIDPSAINWKDAGIVPTTDGRLLDFAWGRCPKFVSLEAGREVLAELLAVKQKYWLRIITCHTVIDEGPVAGYEIADGVVVRETDGSYPEFMGKCVPGCRPALPKLVGVQPKKPDPFEVLAEVLAYSHRLPDDLRLKVERALCPSAPRRKS